MKCNAQQYVGKVEAQGADKRVNKHLNDVRRPDGLAIDRHFDKPDHDFNHDQQRLTSKNQPAKSSLTSHLVEWRVAYKQQVVLTLGSAPDNRHSFHLHVSIQSDCTYKMVYFIMCTVA